MDLATAERLISAQDPKSLAALKPGGNDPVAAKAVAGQFAALLMQNILQDSAGTAMPIAGDGTGGNIVSGLFASAVSQAAASGDKLGLADILFRAIEAKQQQSAAPGSDAKAVSKLSPGTAGGSAALRSAGAARGFSLRPYWQDGGLRPLANTAPAKASPPSIALAGAMTRSADSRAVFATAAGAPVLTSALVPPASVASHDVSGAATASGQVQSFVRQLRPMLAEAGRQLGVSPRILLAHAALETGWGRSVVGNNLFGIKAGATWPGAQVTTLTHEVEAGERVSREAAFRAYPSFDASVQDYVALIGGDRRYQGLIGAGDDAAAYGRGLVAGGYATDGDYGSKLEAVAAEAAAAFAAPNEPGHFGFYGAAETAVGSAAPRESGHLRLFAGPGWSE